MGRPLVALGGWLRHQWGVLLESQARGLTLRVPTPGPATDPKPNGTSNGKERVRKLNQYATLGRGVRLTSRPCLQRLTEL